MFANIVVRSTVKTFILGGKLKGLCAAFYATWSVLSVDVLVITKRID